MVASRTASRPMSFIGTLSQTLTLRAAFASSTYLLSQIPGPGRSSDDDLLIPLIPFSRGRSGPTGFPSPQGCHCSPTPARHLMMPCCSFWTMAGQRHCPRRIAKHLSRAGLCRCRRNYVTRFLQKNLVSICVIAFDVNYIEDRKSVAIGDF
mgnify:CR=1 FL=1